MNQQYFVGYVDEGGKHSSQLLKPTPVNLAAFIVRNAVVGQDVTVTTCLDTPFLKTCGCFIDYCADQEFLRNELLPVLVPMQLGETEPPEVELISEDEALKPDTGRNMDLMG
jgi:hypothetical protein